MPPDLFAFCRNEFPQAQALPAGHVPLARLLRLTPEDRPFPTPVQAGRGGPKIVNHTKVQGSAFPLSGIVRLRKLLKEQTNIHNPTLFFLQDDMLTANFAAIIASGER